MSIESLSAARRRALFKETYKICGKPYDPNFVSLDLSNYRQTLSRRAVADIDMHTAHMLNQLMKSERHIKLRVKLGWLPSDGHALIEISRPDKEGIEEERWQHPLDEERIIYAEGQSLIGALVNAIFYVGDKGYSYKNDKYYAGEMTQSEGVKYRLMRYVRWLWS